MTPLKLAALDEQDLAILSAHCQDAVLAVGDFDYQPARQQFTVILRRFAWESRPRGWLKPSYERHLAALNFDRVLAVRTTGIDRDKPDTVLSLLALRWTAGDVPSGTVELVFAGGPAVQLDVECIEASLADLGAAWETAARPAHPA